MTILPVGSCNATYSLFNFETPYTLFLTCHKNRYNTHLSPRLLHRSFVLEFFVFSVENHFRRFLIPISDHRKPNLSHPLPVSPLFCSSNCFPPKYLNSFIFINISIPCIFHAPHERSNGRHLFPSRFFTIGDEPDGLRITPYHLPQAWMHKAYIRALEEDELEVLKASSFGKFIELADQSPYSGRLGRFMMSRQ
ncbi:unnamed protein product, partial [Brassica oleracea]